MRSRATSQDQINKIRDRTIMCLFKARRNRLQNISKDNLRIFQKISSQKSGYSSENRSKSYRSVHEKGIQNQRRVSCKGLSPMPTGETLVNLTNITNMTRPISGIGIRNSKVSIAQKQDIYSLPSLSKEWNFTSVIDDSKQTEKQKQEFKKCRQTEKIDRAWTRLKSKYKLGGGLILLN